MENFLRVFVAGLDAFEIEDREAAEFAHGDGEADVDDAIHRAGEDGNRQLERFAVPRGG